MINNWFQLGSIVPKAILCVFLYFTSDSGEDAFELPLPMWWELFLFPSSSLNLFLLNSNHIQIFQRYPFEWKNPAGYLLLAVPIQCLTSFCTLQYLACFLTLAFGHTIFTLAFFKDMIRCLHVINKNGKAKKSRPKILKQFIELDSAVKMLRSSFELQWLVISCPDCSFAGYW